jgi:hypothetical protein
MAGPSNTSMKTKPRMAKPRFRRWRVRFSWVEITSSRTARRVFCVSYQVGVAIQPGNRARHPLRGAQRAPCLRMFIAPLPPAGQPRLRKCEV